MLKAIVQFLSCQTSLERYLSLYFFSLLVYMLVIFYLKRKHKKALGIFLLKYRDALCGITYIILVIFLVGGCMINAVIENILVYLGIMLLTAVILNFLFILGYGVKKIKDVEFSEAADAYAELITYCETSDRIMEYMTSFTSYVGCIDEDDVNSLQFNEFTEYWLSCISEYLDNRIKAIDYVEAIKNKQVLMNYIKDIVAKEKLWYTDTQIEFFANKLILEEEVILTDKIRIIPISGKRFKLMISVVGNDVLKDFDRSFLINTFCMLCLL